MTPEQAKEIIEIRLNEYKRCYPQGSEYVQALEMAVKTLAVIGQVKWERGKWVPCSERMPEEKESIFNRFYGTDKWMEGMFRTRSDEVNATILFDDGTRLVKTINTTDGIWHIPDWMKERNAKVIAWMPFAKPYKED